LISDRASACSWSCYGDLTDLGGEVCEGIAGHAGVELLDGDGLPGGEHGLVDFAVGAFPYEGLLAELTGDAVQLAHGHGGHVDGEDLRRAAGPRRIGSSRLAGGWHCSKLTHEFFRRQVLRELATGTRLLNLMSAYTKTDLLDHLS
jgi:hypothetical protein